MEQERVQATAGSAEPCVTAGERLTLALVLISLQQAQYQQISPLAKAVLVAGIQRQIPQRGQPLIQRFPGDKGRKQ